MTHSASHCFGTQHHIVQNLIGWCLKSTDLINLKEQGAMLPGDFEVLRYFDPFR